MVEVYVLKAVDRKELHKLQISHLKLSERLAFRRHIKMFIHWRYIHPRRYFTMGVLYGSALKAAGGPRLPSLWSSCMRGVTEMQSWKQNLCLFVEPWLELDWYNSELALVMAPVHGWGLGIPGRWKLATFLPFRLCSLQKAPLSGWQVVKTDVSLFLFEVTYGGWGTMPQWTKLKENYFLTTPSTGSKSSGISPGVKETN